MNSKKAEIFCPTKLSIEEQFHHRNMPFSSDPKYETNKRKSIAAHLIDFALILAELQPIHKKQKLLDIGAGGAWTTEWFIKCGLNAYAVDISSHWSFASESRDVIIPYIICDAECLSEKFEEGSIDFIVFYNSLHHMLNQQKIIEECFIVLKEGGKVIFLEPGYNHSKKQNTKEAMERFGTIERGIDPFKLKRDCKRVGFSKSYLKADFSIFPNLRRGNMIGDWNESVWFSSLFALFSPKGRAFVVGIK